MTGGVRGGGRPVADAGGASARQLGLPWHLWMALPETAGQEVRPVAATVWPRGGERAR